MFPLIFFVGFAGALSRVDQVPGFDYAPGYETFQFAFVLLQSAAMAGVFTGFGIAQDFERGFARRLMIAAPRRSGIIVGYALATMVRWIFNTGRVRDRPADGDGRPRRPARPRRAARARTDRQPDRHALGRGRRAAASLDAGGPIMQFPIFLLIFLAPVFVPIDLLTGWIHTVASVNPFTAFIEGARSLLAGSTEEVAIAFGIAIPLAAAVRVSGR